MTFIIKLYKTLETFNICVVDMEYIICLAVVLLKAVGVTLPGVEGIDFLE